MHEARPDVSYSILAVDDLLIHQPEKVQKFLKTVIEQFRKGEYKPLPCISFPIDDAENAFEYLQGAKNIGKVILTILERQPVQIDPNSQLPDYRRTWRLRPKSGRIARAAGS